MEKTVLVDEEIKKLYYKQISIYLRNKKLTCNYFESGSFTIPSGVSDHGITMAFLTMSMCEIFHSFTLRSQRKSVFSLHSHNKILWAAMLGSLLLTTLVLEVPFLANAFGFTSVGAAEYGVALCLAVLVILVVEAVKFFQRRRRRQN